MWSIVSSRRRTRRCTTRARSCDWAACLENVYLDEISTFIAAIDGSARWPYSYGESALVCGTLAAAELSMMTGTIERVRADLVPAPVPDAYLLRPGAAR